MPIPDLIEIVPLARPARAEIVAPGSKSITNRALILAALGVGETVLQGALWSEDTQVMVESLKRLGFEIVVESDPDETCNRSISVRGLGGRIPAGGRPGEALELFVGNAGTAARFLAPLVCLGRGVYRLHGEPRMHERPQAAMFDALRQLGYEIAAPGNKLPALIHGRGPQPGRCVVSVAESSQFASGLLLSSGAGEWEIDVVGENEEESPYISMTEKVIEAFPRKGGVFRIEPDASSGSYFWAAGHYEGGGRREGLVSTVSVANWPKSGWQIDARFERLFHKLVRGSRYFEVMEPGLAGGPLDELIDAGERILSRRSDLGDSIMTAIVMAPLAAAPFTFTDLARLRLQECERVRALRVELTKCGAKVIEAGDTLRIFPSNLHGAEIETYQDHRMAMCFSILGLKVPGIRIKNPACVKKTFPNFFQKLAGIPPRGLGATILDAKSGRQLEVAELFAG
jgi:3-phosphoshikimate 1-carboxyvinyltransferase